MHSNKNWHNKEEKLLSNLKKLREQKQLSIKVKPNKDRGDKNKKDKRMYSFIRKLSEHSVQILILTTTDHVYIIWKLSQRKKNHKWMLLNVEMSNGIMSGKNRRKEQEDFMSWTKDQNKEEDKLY